jgi:hypothetical protein
MDKYTDCLFVCLPVSLSVRIWFHSVLLLSFFLSLIQCLSGLAGRQRDRQRDRQTNRHRQANRQTDRQSSVNSTINLTKKKKYILNVSKKKQILDLGLCAHRA